MDNIDQILQEMRDRLSRSATTEVVDVPAPVVESDASEISAILAQIDQLRQKLQVPDTISNAKLLELALNNEFIPGQTTAEERRTHLQIFGDWLGEVDRRWMSWTDSWSGKLLFYLTLIGVLAVVIVPIGMQRQILFNNGYKAAQQRCEAGLQP